MDLKTKILNPHVPVSFFEMVPPVAGKPEALESAMAEIARIEHLADAINLPEIHDESRGSERTFKFVERIEPRVLGGKIRQQFNLDVVLNRCVVYQPNQVRWFQETEEKFGIRNFILVGGESSRIEYPGPSVIQTAQEVRAAGLPVALGGISIPSSALPATMPRLKRRS